jgi:hypothetical protein
MLHLLLLKKHRSSGWNAPVEVQRFTEVVLGGRVIKDMNGASTAHKPITIQTKSNGKQIRFHRPPSY